jgi:peptidoglycan/xylan/chitin deacetylase (PgdA/CDA1 family)
MFHLISFFLGVYNYLSKFTFYIGFQFLSSMTSKAIQECRNFGTCTTIIIVIFGASLLLAATFQITITPTGVYSYPDKFEEKRNESIGGGGAADVAAATANRSASELPLGNSPNEDNAKSRGETYRNGKTSAGNNTDKLVIINFDDSYYDQIIYAKPILDKYGFKVTFFQICGRISESGWRDIAQLQKSGMDIQAHTMTHSDLNELSAVMLDIELRKAKECFLNNRINTTIFAYPYGNGWNNETVVNTVAKYYDLARTNSGHPLTFLNCDLWNEIPYGIGANDSSNSMPSCVRNENDTSVGSNGSLTNNMPQTLGSSRYSINSWSHNHIEGRYDYGNLSCIGICHYYNNSQMFERFVEAVNSQNDYNKDGTIRAIPIIVYHKFVLCDDVSQSKIPTDTSVNLFNLEMKYLHDNGFKVLTMADLGYDENRSTLYVRDTTGK